MKPRKIRVWALALTVTSALLAARTHASELVYYPLNPAFGGNPQYGTYFLNSALATNKHKDTDLEETGLEKQTPLEVFNETLERAILSRVASAASSRIIGNDGQFIPGRLETDNFTIDVSDPGTGILTITTFDKLMGGATTFQVRK